MFFFCLLCFFLIVVKNRLLGSEMCLHPQLGWAETWKVKVPWLKQMWWLFTSEQLLCLTASSFHKRPKKGKEGKNDDAVNCTTATWNKRFSLIKICLMQSFNTKLSKRNFQTAHLLFKGKVTWLQTGWFLMILVPNPNPNQYVFIL